MKKQPSAVIVVAAGKEAIENGINCAEIVKEIQFEFGGKGGGNESLATLTWFGETQSEP